MDAQQALVQVQLTRLSDKDKLKIRQRLKKLDRAIAKLDRQIGLETWIKTSLNFSRHKKLDELIVQRAKKDEQRKQLRLRLKGY